GGEFGDGLGAVGGGADADPVTGVADVDATGVGVFDGQGGHLGTGGGFAGGLVQGAACGSGVANDHGSLYDDVEEGRREARRGEAAKAPAVPTGSTATGQRPASGRHQTKGPKTLPVPVEPTGRALRLRAPQTCRAWPPGLWSTYAGPSKVPGTQARRLAAERRTRRCRRHES